MFGKLLFLFIAFPLLEIIVLVKLGDAFGFWPTLLLVVGTGFAGALIARLEGFRTWLAIREELRNGRIPGEKLIDAFLLLVAGIFLITPGFLSDLMGIFLLIPWTRFFAKRWLRKKFDEMLRSPAGPSFHFFIR